MVRRHIASEISEWKAKTEIGNLVKKIRIGAGSVHEIFKIFRAESDSDLDTMKNFRFGANLALGILKNPV